LIDGVGTGLTNYVLEILEYYRGVHGVPKNMGIQ